MLINITQYACIAKNCQLIFNAINFIERCDCGSDTFLLADGQSNLEAASHRCPIDMQPVSLRLRNSRSNEIEE